MTAEFLRKVRSTLWDRQIFRTSKLKLLGLGPSNSQDEMTVRDVDEVWVIKGCSVPVIFRVAKEEEGKYYRFVGESYVHGLMGGMPDGWLGWARGSGLL
jgi:hypothetical protein